MQLNQLKNNQKSNQIDKFTQTQLKIHNTLSSPSDKKRPSPAHLHTPGASAHQYALGGHSCIADGSRTSPYHRGWVSLLGVLDVYLFHFDLIFDHAHSTYLPSRLFVLFIHFFNLFRFCFCRFSLSCLQAALLSA